MGYTYTFIVYSGVCSSSEVNTETSQQDKPRLWFLEYIFCAEFTCWLHQFPPTIQTLVIRVDCTLELPVGVK